MKSLVVALFIFFSLLACSEKKTYNNKNEINIKVEPLDSLEIRLFSQLNCPLYDDNVVKKIIITNDLYDTLRIWVMDYCQPSKSFILCDTKREYVSDTLISIDLTNTRDGHPIEIIRNKSRIVYNRSSVIKENSKLKYTFWAESDSLGIKKNIKLHFFESN